MTHDTAYAGYAALGSNSLEQIQEEPFFGRSASSHASSPSSSPKKASLASKQPRSLRKHPRGPSKVGTAELDRTNTGIHDAVMHPITCTPSSTLKDVRPSAHLDVPAGQLRACLPACCLAGWLACLLTVITRDRTGICVVKCLANVVCLSKDEMQTCSAALLALQLAVMACGVRTGYSLTFVIPVQVLHKMVSNSVHRIYVVQDESHLIPEHSVTPTDIMQMLSLLHT